MAEAKDLLLIYPRLRYPSGDPPLGILYLAGYLRQKLGMVPEILDLSFAKNPWQTLCQKLEEKKYQWIGISAMVTMAESSEKVAELVRSLQPRAKIILGGPHPTTLPEKCQSKNFDFLVLGEGEETFAQLLGKGTGEGVEGVWFRVDGHWEKNPSRTPLQDLDQIPFPAFDLVDLSLYQKYWFQLDTLGKPISGTNILASRGCPFQCTFCQPTLERLFGKKLRKRSPKNIIQELFWLKERFGIQGFIFADDTLIVDKNWCRELAREMLAQNLGLVFGANVRAELVEEDTLRALKEAGLRKIYLGIESWSDRIRREVLGKNFTREEVEQAVSTAKKLDLKIQGYFMLGAPGESREEVKKTLKYARQLGLDDITINLTTPLPGTYLYQKYHSQIEAEEKDFDYYRRWVFKKGELSQRWLRAQQILGYFGFYLRPKKFFKILRENLSPKMLARTGLKLKRVLG